MDRHHDAKGLNEKRCGLRQLLELARIVAGPRDQGEARPGHRFTPPNSQPWVHFIQRHSCHFLTTSQGRTWLTERMESIAISGHVRRSDPQQSLKMLANFILARPLGSARDGFAMRFD